MTEPIISLCYLTYRPGGIDLLFESLRNQEPIYELIIVDDFPGRIERGGVAAYAKRLGVNLTHHVPSKPHSYPEHYGGMMNAYNTGASWCRTDFVVFVHDYIWFPPGALMTWLKVFERYLPQTAYSGIAFRHRARQPEKHEDLTVWDTELTNCDANILEQVEEWHPLGFENFYCGMPIKVIECVNGFDERVDCGHITWSVPSMALQINHAGCQFISERRLRVEMVDHHHWEHFDKSLWSAWEASPKLWYLPPAPAWVSPSPNPYDFKELRKQNLAI